MNFFFKNLLDDDEALAGSIVLFFVSMHAFAVFVGEIEEWAIYPFLSAIFFLVMIAEIIIKNIIVWLARIIFSLANFFKK